MKKVLSIVFMIMFACTFLTGCMISHKSHTTDSSSDYSISRAQLNSVEAGITTKEWIIENFGEPDRERSLQDGEEVLIYKNNRHRSSHLTLFLLFNSHSSEDIKETVSFKIRDGIVKSYWVD